MHAWIYTDSSLFKCELEPIHILRYVFDIVELQKKGTLVSGPFFMGFKRY